MNSQSDIHTLSILIPAYNEDQTICAILEKIKNVCFPSNVAKEIIVIDDCSVDNTALKVEEFINHYPDLPVSYIKLDKNRGKGYAVRTGIQKAKGDIIIIQDADLEYDPEDYAVLLPHILSGDYKVVYGSRILNKENNYSYKSFYWGGRLVSLVVGLLFSQKLTDEPTCYKMFDAALLKSIPLTCDGFGFCPEVTAKVLNAGHKIEEVPIRYYPRSVKEGKKIKWQDGIQAIWILLINSLVLKRGLLNLLAGLIAYSLVWCCMTYIREYNWVYKTLLKGNYKFAKEHKDLTADQRRKIKLGVSFAYLDYLKKNTPEDAVILMPEKEAYYPKGQQAVFEQEIHNKLFRLRVLYPRKIVDADEGANRYVRQINRVAIVNGYGYERLNIDPTDQPPFAVIPVEQ